MTTIRRVTSGSCEVAAVVEDSLCSQIITSGKVSISSIKVGEASSMIESAQRDLNSSFVSEVAPIFMRIGVDTIEVLESASTQRSFQMSRPGLVGGHCISVDLYHLVHEAGRLGYRPGVIPSGHRVSNRMVSLTATKTINLMISKGLVVCDSQTLIMGVTLKEDCPDVRNYTVVNITTALREFSVESEFLGLVADLEEIEHGLGMRLLFEIPRGVFEAAVGAVVQVYSAGWTYSCSGDSDASVLYGVKAMLDRGLVDGRL